MISSLLIAFDAYERNKKVASLLKKDETVLDVGGGVTGIKLFTENPVKTLDMGEADITADARRLSIAPGSFDVVTCVDVLEHIPKKDRRSFIESIYKIAKKRLIIAAPFKSPKHSEAEKRLLAELIKKGKRVAFLEEHVKLGLSEVKEALIGKGAKVFYSGDFRFSNFLFKLQIYESGVVLFDKLLLILKWKLNILTNIFLYPFFRVPFLQNFTPAENKLFSYIKFLIF